MSGYCKDCGNTICLCYESKWQMKLVNEINDLKAQRGKLVERIDELREEAEDNAGWFKLAAVENRKLEKQNTRLRKALEYYAKKSDSRVARMALSDYEEKDLPE